MPCAMLRSVDDLMSVDVSSIRCAFGRALIGLEALRARVAARGDAPVLAASGGPDAQARKVLDFDRY